MSLPWLSSNFKRSSKSRSRSSSSDSEKKKTRIDEFGRTVPVKSRSRSKSRSRKRSRSRSRDRERSSRERGRRHIGRGRGRGFNRPSRDFGTKGPVRREEKGAKRRRNRSGSQSSDSDCSFDRDTSRPSVRPVASNELKYTCARLFVANVSYKEMNKSDLVKHFEKYGQVLDLLLHPKNYAFVQYSKEEDARLALEGENGSTFQGYRLEVKMAQDGKRDSNSVRGGRGRGRGAAPHDKGWGPGRDDPFIDGPGGSRMPHPPIPGEFGMRDPYFPPLDPYRSYPDPWYPGPSDPYGPAPFADPYLDPFAARAPPPPPLQPAPPPAKVECQIYLVSPKLRAYGEDIEQRVKEHCIITGLSVMPEGHTATQMLEELTDRDGLFAVFVNTQNEAHRSLTLNILHGTPQEHRNMPMNDAIELIGRSFEEYVDTLREKAKAASAANSAVDDTPKPDTFTSASRVFLPASSEVAYLLNLLADNRALTISELGDVIKYLKDRRDKLIDAERRPLATDASAATFSKPQPQTSNVPSSDDLTEKILNLISSTSGGLEGLISSVNVNSAIQQQQQQQQQAHDQQKQQTFQPAPPLPPPPPPPPHQTSTPNTVGGGKSTMINFDNPNVQKALDNLIQSSPVLRQTFISTVSPASTEPPAPSIDSVSQMVGRSSMKGYGQGAGPGALAVGGGAGPESYGMFRMQRPPQPMRATSNTVGLTRPQTYNQEPF